MMPDREMPHRRIALAVRRAAALAVLDIFVLAWLPACSGVMDREKAMDKDKTMVEKSGGTMVIWMVEGRLC